MENNFIKVWRFHDAPKELRALSTNGGDEDWLAVIPPCMSDDWIPWMEDNSPFGVCCVDEYSHPSSERFLVRIGSHS